MPLSKHSAHFKAPHDVKPRRSTNRILIESLAPLPSPEPSGKRIKIREFKYFPKLPPELREMIIKEANKNSRCVTIRKRIVLDKSDVSQNIAGPYCNHLYWIVSAGAAVPQFLQVNKESRSICLKSYELCFGELLAAGPIYFNFAVDSLHFLTIEDGQVFLGARYTLNTPAMQLCKCLPVSQSAKDEPLKRLRYLVIGNWMHRMYNSTQFSFDMFEGLETLVLGRSLNPTVHSIPGITLGRNYNAMVKKPQITFLAADDLAKVTKPAFVRKKKTAVGGGQVKKTRVAKVKAGNKKNTAGTKENPVVLD